MASNNFRTMIFCSITVFSFLFVAIENNPKQSLIGSESLSIDQPFFVVTVPSRNNSEYYKKNIDSILQQDYPYFHVIYTDDASTDNTANLVEKYVKEHNAQDKFTLIRNSTRNKALANHHKMNHMIHPRAITVIMDGDDWFKHPYVLSRLAEVYLDQSVWMTYGSWEEYPSGKQYNLKSYDPNIIQKNSFRKVSYRGNPLRSFYAGLFHKIKKEDLLYDGKTFFPMATDPAFMFPLLEMCGKHSLFIKEILYVYNKNRYSDIGLKPLANYMKQIRAKKPYKPLESIW